MTMKLIAQSICEGHGSLCAWKPELCGVIHAAWRHKLSIGVVYRLKAYVSSGLDEAVDPGLPIVLKALAAL